MVLGSVASSCSALMHPATRSGSGAGAGAAAAPGRTTGGVGATGAGAGAGAGVGAAGGCAPPGRPAPPPAVSRPMGSAPTTSAPRGSEPRGSLPMKSAGRCQAARSGGRKGKGCNKRCGGRQADSTPLIAQHAGPSEDPTCGLQAAAPQIMPGPQLSAAAAAAATVACRRNGSPCKQGGHVLGCCESCWSSLLLRQGHGRALSLGGPSCPT